MRHFTTALDRRQGGDEAALHQALAALGTARAVLKRLDDAPARVEDPT
jgi:hypothetical protein